MAERLRVAIIYARGSTEDQKDKGLSLPSQVEGCLAYAAQHNWKVLRVVEEDASGYQLDERRKFAGVRESLRAGEADLLLCYCADRMSRHQTHSLIIFDSICEAGAELWFVRHGQVEDTPMGRAMLSLYATGAAMERENIIERTTRGKRRRLLEGKFSRSGVEQYGWRRNRKEEVVEIYEPEAAVVRLIYRWVGDEQSGVFTVVKKLNQMGIPAPSVGKRKFKDGRTPRWDKGQVTRILRDPTYKGEKAGWRFKKKHPYKPIYTLRPEEEWIKLPPGTYPAIVENVLWQRVQDRLARNRGERTRNERRPFLLRGFIYCGKCGERLYPTQAHGVSAYRCKSQNVPSMQSCGARSVRAVAVDEWAWNEVSRLLKKPDEILSAIARLNESSDPSLARDLALAKKGLQRTQLGISRLIARLRETDDEEMIDLINREINSAREERKNWQGTIDEIEMRLSAQTQIKLYLDQFKELLQAVGSSLDDFSLENRILTLGGLDARVYAMRDEYSIFVDPLMLGSNSPGAVAPLAPSRRDRQSGGRESRG